jgi:hypothetical protein
MSLAFAISLEPAYHRPVYSLQIWIAEKSVIDRRDPSSPHQNEDAQVVEFIPVQGKGAAVVAQNVECCRKCEADGDSIAVNGHHDQVDDPGIW